MSYNIVVLNEVNLLPEAQNRISNLAGKEVTFPSDTPASEEELIARTGNAEAILMSPSVKITANYLDACTSLKYVGLCGTSTANIDSNALTDRGITLTNVTDYGDEPTAEFIFMELVSLARGAGKYQWQKMPRELMGKTMTIIGLGALGKAIARLALAYKMNVNYYSNHRKPEWEAQGLHYARLHDLLPQSDIVLTSVPTGTKVLRREEFAFMQEGTIFVQASAGSTFEKEAILEWLARKHNFAIFASTIGVHDYESLKDLPRVMFPKVIVGYTQEAKERLGQRVFENLNSYLQGQKAKG